MTRVADSSNFDLQVLDYNAIMKNEPLGQATQDLSKLRANSEWTYKARSSLDNLKN